MPHKTICKEIRQGDKTANKESLIKAWKLEDCCLQEGSWNKIGILRKILATYTAEEVEWILWMEPDAIFDDSGLTMPFEFYQGKDIITVADPDLAANGDLDGEFLRLE